MRAFTYLHVTKVLPASPKAGSEVGTLVVETSNQGYTGCIALPLPFVGLLFPFVRAQRGFGRDQQVLDPPQNARITGLVGAWRWGRERVARRAVRLWWHVSTIWRFLGILVLPWVLLWLLN